MPFKIQHKIDWEQFLYSCFALTTKLNKKNDKFKNLQMQLFLFYFHFPFIATNGFQYANAFLEWIECKNTLSRRKCEILICVNNIDAQNKFSLVIKFDKFCSPIQNKFLVMTLIFNKETKKNYLGIYRL